MKKPVKPWQVGKGSLNKIAKLSDEQLAAAVESKVVNPNMRREDLAQWISENFPTTKNRSSGVLATILFRSSYYVDKFDEFESELNALLFKYLLIIRWRKKNGGAPPSSPDAENGKPDNL